MRLYAERALLADGWARHVVLDIGENGAFEGVERDIDAPPDGAELLKGPVIPGMPNLHSHAFQRGFAGLTEYAASAEDNFWSWRQAMYEFVAGITPGQAQAVAEQLYVEMLKAGYTTVGEFHYLHHNSDGEPYSCLTEMSDRIIAAANAAGIAITHLPVLYAHGGFGGEPPNPGQRRFLNNIDRYGTLWESLFSRYEKQPNVRLGIAPHSLRAVTRDLLHGALAQVSGVDASAPIHIHIAEQVKEVEDCLAWSGKRPVEWLLDNVETDNRWCLVHATHTTPEELNQVVDRRMTVGLCPTTEANLGDGFFAAGDYMRRRGRFGIGSDSNVSVSPIEELRTLEYGERLRHQRRTVLCTSETPSVGAYLYREAIRGGARALGRHIGVFKSGYQADLVVLDADSPALLSATDDQILDAMIFAGNVNPVRDVMVGGVWRVRDGHHAREEEILEQFRNTRRQMAF